MEDKEISFGQAKKIAAKRDPYVGVLLESINGNVKFLLEEYETVQDRIDKLDGRVNKLEVRVDRVEIQ